jgi:hypothetical protein
VHLDIGVGRGGGVAGRRRGLVGNHGVVVVLVAVDIPQSRLEERADEAGQAGVAVSVFINSKCSLKAFGGTYKARKANAASVFLIALWPV